MLTWSVGWSQWYSFPLYSWPCGCALEQSSAGQVSAELCQCRAVQAASGLPLGAGVATGGATVFITEVRAVAVLMAGVAVVRWALASYYLALFDRYKKSWLSMTVKPSWSGPRALKQLGTWLWFVTSLTAATRGKTWPQAFKRASEIVLITTGWQV